ncbi:hypothetical protein MMC30_008370 [Trapelia coarctata]|nr:hypothetical protein [Trapelia coarctata]
MSAMEGLIHVVARQAASTIVGAATATSDAASAPTDSPVGCATTNDYNGSFGARVSSIFVILICASLGAVLPVFAHRNRGIKVPQWVFFVAKYFGSGVIIATAFIHLLAPANAALTDPCLTGPITSYSWVEGIALITVFVLFFIELMAMRYSTFSHDSTLNRTNDPDHSHALADKSSPADITPVADRTFSTSSGGGHVPGDDHLGHTRSHVDYEIATAEQPYEDYAAAMTAIFILEFGVVFHSIFVGLTLAVSGAEFSTLYIVIVFHQTFEGLGLGSRLAVAPWPKTRRWTPYLMGIGYAFSTPISIAAGLGVRDTYAPGSQTALIVNGVFDSISAGILIYTGLVELMAHEFMFSEVMRRAKLSVVLSAVGLMCLGAGLMALLGEWA